ANRIQDQGWQSSYSAYRADRRIHTRAGEGDLVLPGLLRRSTLTPAMRHHLSRSHLTAHRNAVLQRNTRISHLIISARSFSFSRPQRAPIASSLLRRVVSLRDIGGRGTPPLTPPIIHSLFSLDSIQRERGSDK